MSNEIVAFVVSILLILAALVFVIGVYNRLQRLANLIPEAAANVAVLLQKRGDLIGKLVAIVDSYGIHESTIVRTVSADFGAPAHVATQGSLVERLTGLRMSFPQLRADRLYDSLITELAGVEAQIADRREQVNCAVRSYNTLLSQFPNNVLMRPFGFQREPFFSDEDLERARPSA